MANSLASVVHITSWLSRSGGGIPPVIQALGSQQSRLGIGVSCAGLVDPDFAADGTDWGVPVIAGSIAGSSAFGYSPELRNRLRSITGPGTVLHVHGLWMYPGVLARRLATRSGAPVVISPHGMLEPWALNNSRLKKRIATFLFENRNLRSSACLHALCKAEAQNIRAYGLQNPIAVVPNGVHPGQFCSLPDYEVLERDNPQLKRRKKVLFLGRLHPKKGLRNLVMAWAKVERAFPGWTLLVCGMDEAGHERELRRLAGDLNLQSVQFLGPKFGAEKLKYLGGADLFVLPSFSEGFSMAVLEAAAAGLPVLLTPECNFPELRAAGGAIEVAATVEGCEAGLRQLMEMSDSARKEMGAKGRALVERDYTWPVIARQMLSVYEWVLGSGPRPDCVQV